MGAADVTVQGAATGAIKGSALFSGTTMTFVASAVFWQQTPTR